MLVVTWMLWMLQLPTLVEPPRFPTIRRYRQLASEKLLEFIKFNFSRTVLINFSDERFDVYCHLEVVLDNLDELVGIDTTFTTFFTSKGDKGVH